MDGGKALQAAVKKYAGEAAPIQRCQVHKRRNVLDHVTDDDKPIVAKKLNAAYAMEDYAAVGEYAGQRGRLGILGAVYFMFYNFGRVYQTLKKTPAMAAGIANHCWSAEEIIGLLQKVEPKATRAKKNSN